MKVVVDWALCDGNGVCSVEAPDLFELDDDDQLVVLKDEFGTEFEQQALAAVRVCPKRALQFER